MLLGSSGHLMQLTMWPHRDHRSHGRSRPSGSWWWTEPCWTSTRSSPSRRRRPRTIRPSALAQPSTCTNHPLVQAIIVAAVAIRQSSSLSPKRRPGPEEDKAGTAGVAVMSSVEWPAAPTALHHPSYPLLAVP